MNFERNSNILWAKNLYVGDIETNPIYISCSEKISSFTGDKNFFLGDGGISNPQALKKIILNNDETVGKKACLAYEVEVELESFASKDISIILGAEEKLMDCKNIAYKYSKLQNCTQELNAVKSYWKELLRKTPSLYSFRII